MATVQKTGDADEEGYVGHSDGDGEYKPGCTGQDHSTGLRGREREREDEYAAASYDHGLFERLGCNQYPRRYAETRLIMCT